jgi:hypothetical protein
MRRPSCWARRVTTSYRRRTHDLVRRSASAEAAERRHGVSSLTVTRCQRSQPGQRTVWSDRSGWITIRAPQQPHRLRRRGSWAASRTTWASNGPPTRASGRYLIATSSGCRSIGPAWARSQCILRQPPARGRHTAAMLRNRLAEGAEHFLVCRETAGCLLGESQPAVHRDLEDAAAGPAQIDLRRGLCLQDRVPRRTGARFIASLAAVFDLDLHDGLVSWLWTPRAAWQRRPRFRKRREGPRVSGRNIPAPSSGGSMNTRRFQARAMALALGLA